MSKESRMNELIENYRSNMTKNYGSTKPLACIARDNMRKIASVFEREMHETIYRYIQYDTCKE